MSYWESWQRGYSSPWQSSSSWDEWYGGDVWTGWEGEQEMYRRSRWRQESSSSSDNSMRRGSRLQETQRAAGALEERNRQRVQQEQDKEDV